LWRGRVKPAVTTIAERKALNEGTFRDANERLERGAVELIGVGDEQLVPFLCECPQIACTKVVLLTLQEYEQVRSGSKQGLAALGHEDPEVENVIDRNDRFVTTEKFGRAGEVHEARDERTNE
jgi:hypothetical protein